MTDRDQYAPGPASGAEVRKDGEKWTLILASTKQFGIETPEWPRQAGQES